MLLNLEQRTQAWYDWRNGTDLPDKAARITATSASVIMGKSPFQTASQLWEVMVGLRAPKTVNAAMQIGVDYEDIARLKLQDKIGVEFFPMCAQADDMPTAGASLDGINAEFDVIAEIKVPGHKTLGLAAQGVVPDHYADQIQWQLYCSGAKQCAYFAYDYQLEDGFVVIVDRNEARIAEMRAAAVRFRQCVLERTPPGGFDLEFEAAILAGLLREKTDLEARIEAARKTVTDIFESLGLTETRSGGLVIVKVAGKAGSTSWKKVAAMIGKEHPVTPEQMATCIGEPTPAGFRIELACARSKKKDVPAEEGVVSEGTEAPHGSEA